MSTSSQPSIEPIAPGLPPRIDILATVSKLCALSKARLRKAHLCRHFLGGGRVAIFYSILVLSRTSSTGPFGIYINQGTPCKCICLSQLVLSSNMPKSRHALTAAATDLLDSSFVVTLLEALQSLQMFFFFACASPDMVCLPLKLQ